MDLKKIGGIVAVVLIALMILGRFVSSPSSHQASAVAASPVGFPTDRWRVTESRSAIDDSRTVVLALDSDDTIQGPIGSNRPTLIVRCKEGKVEVYINTGMAASLERDLDGGPEESHTVRIRLDDNTATSEGWLESNSHKALFAPDAIYDDNGGIVSYSGGAAESAKQLANASRLTFQFTPFDGNPQTARFDVRGLREHLNKVADACGWHID